MAHFKIVGGDFPKTTGIRTSSFSGDITLVVPKSLFKIDKYELKKNIVMLEQITEDLCSCEIEVWARVYRRM